MCAPTESGRAKPLSFPKNQRDAQKRHKQNDNQEKHAVAGNAFFVSQGAQPLDATCSEIVHQPGIRRRWRSKLALNPIKKRRQVIFPDPKVIIMIPGRADLLLLLKTVDVDMLENGFD